MAAYASGQPLEDAMVVQHTTLVAALKHTASVSPSPNGITYVDGGSTSLESYSELLLHSRKTLLGLLELNLDEGDALVLQIVSRRDHFHVFWACLLRGIIPVTVAIPSQYEATNAVVLKLMSTIRQLDARNVMASSTNTEMIRMLLPVHVQAHDVELLPLDLQQGADDELEAKITPQHVAFYQLTSGSTGTPKVIPERHDAIISHIRHSASHCSYAPTGLTRHQMQRTHRTSPRTIC